MVSSSCGGAPSPSSVVFFVGEAAQHLQLRGVEPQPHHLLRALPHALTLPSGFQWRAWYGVMFLLPKDALVQEVVHSSDTPIPLRTFGEVWESASSVLKAMGGDDEHSEGVGCAKGRRLADPSDSCGEGKLACWMQCMKLEGLGLDTCKGATWTHSGPGPIMKATNLEVQCLQEGTGKKWPEEAGTHCGSCKPMCGTTSATPGSGSHTPTPGSAPAGESPFCITMPGGFGTTMYMDGFKFSTLADSEVCVAFLFPGLVLDAPWKFALGCFMAVLMSASLEFIALGRKQSEHYCVKILLQAVTLALAYIAMLFVMTYSLELFLCTILGLVLGPMAVARISKKVAPSGCNGDVEEPHTQIAEVGPGAPCCRMAVGMTHA